MDLSKPAVTASQSTASIEKAFRREGNGCTATFEGQVRERNRFLPSGKSNLEQVAQDGGVEAQWQRRDRERCSEQIQESAPFCHIH